MSALTFDTIEYFDELINAGVPEQQAKAQTKALKRAVTSALDGELAIKSDLLEVQNILTSDLLEVKNVLTADLKDLEIKIEKRFARLEVLITIMLAVLLLPTIKSLF